MLNKVMLIGRLGQDPEVKQVNDTYVANFSIATNKRWANKEGERQEATEWHRIEAWGKTAELCGEYLSKGRQVYLEGELKTDKVEKDDGTTSYYTKVRVNNVLFLGSKNDGGELTNPGDDEDIPF